MSEGESLGLGIFLVVGAACYAALFIALFAYAAAHALQPPGTALMLAALAVLATTSALGYALWECTNGSAFSYFFPLHGARRMAHRTWRIGTLLKTALVGTVLALVVGTLLRADIAWSIDNLRILSPLSALDALLVPLCFAFPLAALAVYACGRQFDDAGGAQRRDEKVSE